MGDIAQRGNRLTFAKGGRIGLKHGKGPHGFGPKPYLHKPGVGPHGHLGGRKKKAIGGVIKKVIQGGKKIISKIKGKGKKGLGSGIKPSEMRKTIPTKEGRREYLKQWSPHYGGRSLKQEMKGKPHAAGGRIGYALGSAVQIGKTVKKYAKEYHKKKKLAEDTKKGKFPETESLTHQVGPYVGDVGSERPGIKRKQWKTPDWKKKPKWSDMPRRPLEKPKWSDMPRKPLEKSKMQPLKKGGKSDKKWIQKAVNPKHKGYCTPMTKKTCTPARKALARTFKKKAKTGW